MVQRKKSGLLYHQTHYHFTSYCPDLRNRKEKQPRRGLACGDSPGIDIGYDLDVYRYGEQQQRC